jgi:hypothetical protein
MVKQRGRGAPVGWMVPTLLLFVLLPVGYAVFTAVRGGDDGTGDGRPKLSRDGSKEVTVSKADEGRPLEFGTEPESYELTYRIERYDPDKVQVSQDKISVRRPFDSRVQSSIDGRKTGDRASRFGTLVISTGEGPRTLVSPPAPATADLRLATSLPDALAQNWVEVRERRKVAGQLCQVYRAGSTVVSGTLVPVDTTAGEHSDLCVDRQGLLLEEVWFKDGKPLQRRVVTKRVVGSKLPDDRFQLGLDEQAVTIDQGNGFIREVDPNSAFEGTVYRLTAPPDGATYKGRFVVQPPTLNPFQSPLDGPTAHREQVSLIDVWTRGADTLVFSQTIAADISALPSNSKTAQKIQLGPIGEAATVVDLRSNEVRAELPEGRFLRIAGSFPRQELLDLAGSLRAEEGKGLVFLPG